MRVGTSHRQLALLLALAPLAAGLRLGVRPRAPTPRLGLFDALFGDPGASTACPAGFVQASHILLIGPGAAESAEALRVEIESGAISFADAATKYSECPSKGKGGDLGMFSSLARLAFLPYEGQSAQVAAFDTLVFDSGTPIGKILDVTTDWGVHLVRVDARG
jgi:hypothetical protein